MKRINTQRLNVGQQVTIRTRDGQKLSGILVDKCDWSVGCPVVEANGIKYGIGYQAEILSVPGQKANNELLKK
ncbi:TPA: hypothetical protein RKY22_003649 [Klebsiella michiganensis]|uniref:hypothetical protein n=1 Tax=Klebsiella TaxID=570 RepID=UPI00027C3102|nr:MULTISPECIES: hypothetical protein [Klebsiella]HBR1446533.1 hypothetical protein [Klebsiella quasipneumoniae subsp. quasipneumoniae]EJU22729.1 hypothetical protein HMPREF1144_5616 [Klebsiella sp. OBRC7]MBR7637619.1 hypothetical protein [Klebsiella michiganensis]MDU7818267.1 hypothetical protein [Klebsiella sp.]HCT4445325.1 hypothetical protein [Klebsiella michiganensis]